MSLSGFQVSNLDEAPTGASTVLGPQRTVFDVQPSGQQCRRGRCESGRDHHRALLPGVGALHEVAAPVPIVRLHAAGECYGESNECHKQTQQKPHDDHDVSLCPVFVTLSLNCASSIACTTRGKYLSSAHSTSFLTEHLPASD